MCLALEYVSGTIDYFIEENKNDGVVEKRFVLPTETLFYKVQKFFKEEVKKYDILELDSLMRNEGTTIEKSHCKELLESEMFGHKAGSFTGALKDKKGLFTATKFCLFRLLL